MGLKDDVANAVTSVTTRDWNIRKGTVVPTTDSITLRNGAVEIDAVYLYADMADSTRLAREFPRTTAAKVIRCYLDATCRVILARGGEIRSFDGDRVMAIFIGDRKNAEAVKCALQVNYAVTKIVRPTLERNLSSLVTKGFAVEHCVGIANGTALVVRGGVRDHNDLLSIGRAPNVAAKLSDVRARPHFTYITASVFQKLDAESRFGGSDRRLMWDGPYSRDVGGDKMDVYKSAWRWSL